MPNSYSKMEDATMCFDIEEGATNYKKIKVSCEDADGNVCKEELPIFTDTGNNNADNKKKQKFSNISGHHNNFTLNAFQDKAQRLIWEIFGDDAYEE